jgi:protein-tyrosine phosphatase
MKRGNMVSVCRSAIRFAALLLIFTATALAQQPPGTSLAIPSVVNLRDVGGYTTSDGSVVRRGVAYRSNQLNPISPGDLQKIAALGLKSDYDLRTEAERQARPDQLPPGVKNVWINVWAHEEGADPADMESLLANTQAANQALGNGSAAAMLKQRYREFVSSDTANNAYRKLFLELSNEKQLPALFHCSNGKDRTGWAAAALLALLGVPEDQVFADYLKSNEYILPAYQSFIDRFVAAGGDPSIPRDLLSAKVEYLRAAFDQVRVQYGTIEQYFALALLIDKGGQQKLRERLLTAKQ